MKKGSQSAWRPTLHTLLVLSVPTIIEQIMATLLQYVDTSMVGQLGENATAAVSITTNITWLINSMPGAIGTAVLILISRALGAGDKEEIRRLSQQALFLAVSSGLVLGLVSIALSPFIPGWMGAEQAIRQEASRYFTIISVPMVFRSISTVMAAALRAVQDTRTPMRIGLLANALKDAADCLDQCAGHCLHDVYKRAGPLYRLRAVDASFFSQYPGCGSGSGDAAAGCAVRTLFRADGRTGRDFLWDGTHTIPVSGGNHRHVGDPYLSDLSVRKHMGTWPQGCVVLHDRR